LLEQHRAVVVDQLSRVGATLAPATPIFCDAVGGLRDPDKVLAAFKKASAEAGVKVVTIHSLRHWHGSSLVDAGLDPVSVAARLGHSAVTTTMDRYAHAFDRQRQKAALTLGELAGGEGA
jgi:integrase